MNDWTRVLLAEDELCMMGHGQRRADTNLGLGWLYYAIGRMQRCETAVVIGSYRGFVPIVIATALAHNVEAGEVIFIDPSFWDEFWSDEHRVVAHFERFGVRNIRHFKMTSQQFVESEHYRALGNVGIVFLDGNHSYDQVRWEYDVFEKKMAPDGVTLIHDAMLTIPETHQGLDGLYITGATFLIDELQQRTDVQVFDMPPPDDAVVFSTGLALIRKKTARQFTRFRNSSMPGYEALRSGIAAFNSRHFARAIEHFTRLVELQPDYVNGALLKGVALALGGDLESGLSCLEEAHERAPRRLAALLEHCIAMLRSEVVTSSAQLADRMKSDLEGVAGVSKS